MGVFLFESRTPASGRSQPAFPVSGAAPACTAIRAVLVPLRPFTSGATGTGRSACSVPSTADRRTPWTTPCRAHDLDAPRRTISKPSGCRSPRTGVQGDAAPAVARPRACTTPRHRRPRRCSTAPPACGASTPATAARRSSRRSRTRRRSWITPRPSRWATPPAFELASRVAPAAAGRPRPRVLHQLRLRGGRHRAEDRARLPRASGQGTRTRLIGRERGYHGVGFGGISVGGMVNNRSTFGTMLTGVDHLPHTHDLERNAFSRGQPALGRASRRRAGAAGRAARRLDHRRRDRRAGGRLDRRAAAARGLSASGCARSATSTASC